MKICMQHRFDDQPQRLTSPVTDRPVDLATDLDQGNLEATPRRLGLWRVPEQFFFF